MHEEAYTEPIVLFVDPDSAEIEKMREELGEDFYVVADDAMWYGATARELLDGLQIRYSSEKRDEAYFQIGGKRQLFNWREVKGWFIVLYNGADEPRISRPISLYEELDYVRGRPPQ